MAATASDVTSTVASNPTSTPNSARVSTQFESDRATPFDTCPRCHGHRFHVERTDDGVAFRCLGCAARWQYELGYLRYIR